MVNTNRPKADIKIMPSAYDVTTTSEHIIDDDSFDITGSENEKNNSKKFFKYVIPTFIAGAVITMGLLISLFVQPIDKDNSNKVAKKDSYKDSLSLEEFLNNNNSSSDLLNEENINDENVDDETLDLNGTENNEDNTSSDNSDSTSPSNSNSNETILAMNDSNNYSSYYNYNENSSNNDTVYISDYSNIPTGSSPSATTNYNQISASDIDISNDVEKSNTDIPVFYQSDNRWGSASFAGSTMSNLGSGPTCLSMISLYFNKNYSNNPLKIANDCTDRNGFISGVGASPSFMTSYASTLGLKAREIKVHKNDIISNIMWKKPVIAYMKPGTFSSQATYIVIRSYDMKNFMINDPNSSSNSEKTWRHDKLTKNIDKCWAYSK